MTNKIILLASIFMVGLALADTTIDPKNKYAYGANIGWINAEADVINGMVVGQAFCSGYMYSANCGWIHLGDGVPDNQKAYGNDSATDYGINHDGLGALTGYAYGANIGWINFEQKYGKPTVDLSTGILSGYVWSGNVGWINLNTTQGYVKTLTMDSGPDKDKDGIPDAWEYGHTKTLLALGTGDADGDGVSDVDEYLADTNPFDKNDVLKITQFKVAGSTNWVTWTANPTREYALLNTTALSNGIGWAEGTASIPSAGPDMTEEVSGATNSTQFYRVQASPPLAP